VKELVVELLPSWLSGDQRDQLLYVLALALLGFGTVLCLLAVRVPVLDVAASRWPARVRWPGCCPHPR
jgi:hypothetical protein